MWWRRTVCWGRRTTATGGRFTASATATISWTTASPRPPARAWVASSQRVLRVRAQSRAVQRCTASCAHSIPLLPSRASARARRRRATSRGCAAERGGCARPPCPLNPSQIHESIANALANPSRICANPSRVSAYSECVIRPRAVDPHPGPETRVVGCHGVVLWAGRVSCVVVWLERGAMEIWFLSVACWVTCRGVHFGSRGAGRA
mmetsp:Transcript_2256/g.5999  ORF Transcript_2256/g.5999 Transcript_2256/m.5999 type:complete len:206 (-) Transcript_2256:8-625(-)